MQLPDFIPPATPVLRTAPPTGPQWVHELKFDGWRLQVRKDGAEVALLSKNGIDLSRRFPSIAMAAARLPGQSFIIDGELIAFDGGGRPSFEAIATRGSELALAGFDLLFNRGRDLRALPLAERRRRLLGILGNAPSRVFLSETFDDAAALLAAVEKHRLEGIVCKRADQPYRSGSRCGWVKVKTEAWRPIGQERQRRFGPK